MMRHPKYMTKAQVYHDSRYYRARNAALHRAGNACEECRKFGRATPADTVHHIVPLEENPSLAFNAANLMALCPACHNKLHEEKSTRGKKKRKHKQNVDA